MAINVTDLEQIKIQITPDDGYYINSVTLDGEELEYDKGEVILHQLSNSSTLNIVFVNEPAMQICSVDDTLPLKVIVNNHLVSIKGLSTNQIIKVYNTQGILIKETNADTFEIQASGSYIMHIGNETFKLAIQ